MPTPIDPKTVGQFRARQQAEVERLRRSFRLFAKRCAIVLALFAFFCLTYFAANRIRLTHYTMNLSHSDDIESASEILAEHAATSHSAREKLKSVMLRLRDGWPGFVPDGYHPFKYTPAHSLDSIYWTVAAAAAKSDASGRAALLKLLDETRPQLSNKDSWKGFKYAFDQHELKYDYPEPR